MDLHALASGAISAINPMIEAMLSRAAGYATANDGSRTATYDTATAISIQFQAMDEGEVRQLNELNISGSIRKIYAEGSLVSLDHKAGTGGDLLVIDSATWLVVHTFEQWPDWVSVAAQKQVD